MSRQSYAYGLNPRQSTRMRESMAPIVDVVGPLDECVRAATECVDTLGSAVDKLEPGVSDMTRLKKVLGTNYHYIVLPAPDIARRRKEFDRALEPELSDLLARASALVQKESAHVARLEARLAELEGARRPAHQPPSYAPSSAAPPAPGASPLDTIDTNSRTLSLPLRRKIHSLRTSRQKLLDEEARLTAALK